MKFHLPLLMTTRLGFHGSVTKKHCVTCLACTHGSFFAIAFTVPCCGNRQQRQRLTRWRRLACVGFYLEEERVIQHRIGKYFPQFENQGINLVGESRQVQSTCANTNELAPNAIKGLSIPSRLIAKCDLKAKSATKYNCMAENMVWSRPGAIVFTRCFSQNIKYYGGWTNYCQAIDRTAQSHQDI